MSSSATGVGMPICFLGAILLILTQKSSQKFGDVLGIMVLDFIQTIRRTLGKHDQLGIANKTRSNDKKQRVDEPHRDPPQPNG